jgi:hypothetical protein
MNGRALCLALFTLAACAPIELAPPSAPARVVPVPSVRLGAPAEGETTLLLDTPGRSTIVSEVIGTSEALAYRSGGVGMMAARSIQTRLLCVMPCEAHVRQGTHELAFETADTHAWAGTGIVQLGPAPAAYRYAIGHREPNAGARVGGVTAISLGLGFVAGGLPLWALQPTPGMGEFGEAMTLGGAGLTIIGAALLTLLRPELQDGAGTLWELSPATSEATPAR